MAKKKKKQKNRNQAKRKKKKMPPVPPSTYKAKSSLQDFIETVRSSGLIVAAIALLIFTIACWGDLRDLLIYHQGVVAEGQIKRAYANKPIFSKISSTPDYLVQAEYLDAKSKAHTVEVKVQKSQFDNIQKQMKSTKATKLKLGNLDASATIKKPVTLALTCLSSLPGFCTRKRTSSSGMWGGIQVAAALACMLSFFVLVTISEVD